MLIIIDQKKQYIHIFLVSLHKKPKTHGYVWVGYKKIVKKQLKKVLTMDKCNGKLAMHLINKCEDNNK